MAITLEDGDLIQGDASSATVVDFTIDGVEEASNVVAIKALADGTLEINGNSDFAVAFNDLKAGFDQLKADYNTFLTTIYNLHTHVSVTSLGTPTVPVPTGSNSSASIDASKVDEVKLP